jgi:hypothetical protein
MEHSQFTQAFDFLFRMSKRITSLEKDTSYYEKKVGEVSVINKSKYSELEKELGLIKLMMQDFRKDLRNCSIELDILGRKVRDAAKVDDLTQLNAQVDTLEFGEYITRNEFERMKLEDIKNANGDN